MATVNRNVTCLACANSEGNHFFTAREMMHGTRDTFHYVECGKCKSLQIADVPANLVDYYPSDYYSFESSRGGRLRQYLRGQRLRNALDCGGVIGWFLFHLYGTPELTEWTKMVKIKFNDRILDVGCGNGRLLCDLYEAGFKHLAGIDPYVQNKITRNGFSIHRRHLTEWKEDQDLVMMHHSFEHMPEPALVLGDLFRILKPGGQALIRTPVANCSAWHQYGSHWVQLDAPRHLFIPSIDGLRKLSENAGLKLVNIRFDSTDFQFWGSELYRRDVPIARVRKEDHFSRREFAVFRKQAVALNKQQDGDQACFLLEKI